MTIEQVLQDRALDGMKRLIADVRQLKAAEVAHILDPDALFQTLPGVRGYWPLAASDGDGDTPDLSGGAGYELNNSSVNAQFGIDATTVGLVPYAEFDGTAEFNRADVDGLSIRGNEAEILPAIRGLTLGGWVYFNNATPGTTETLVAKRGSTDRAYWVQRESTAVITFGVSSNGSAETEVSSTGTVGLDTWTFVVARYTPSTEIALWLSGTEYTSTSSIPSTLFDGVEDFSLGRRANSSLALDGRLSRCFVCAAALPDALIARILEYTETLYEAA